MDTETLTALDDDMEHGFGERHISSAPFSPPSLSPSQYKQLELLQHLALYSELLILFSGAKGMGKTFLANALIASREAPDQSLLVNCDFSISYLDILHKITEHFDLAELDDLERLETQILRYCEELQEDEQGSFLLVLDQAEQLSDETLLHINQLAISLPNALHIMLLGTPTIEEALLALPEPHAPLHIMDVELLTDEESEVILLQQFPEKEWSAEYVDYILSQSQGNVGKLVYLSEQIALGVKPPKVSVAAKFPITHIAAIVLIASAFLMSYLYQNNESSDVSSVVLEGDESVVLLENTAKPVVSDTLSETSADLVGQEEVDFNFVETNATEVADTEVGTSENSDLDAQFIEPTKVASIIAVDVKEKAVESPVSKIAVSSEEKVSKNNLGITKKSAESQQVVKETLLTRDEKKLTNASASSFITQLFGSYSEANAVAFIKQHEGSLTKNGLGALLYYRSEHKGKEWFVVVSGPYSSKSIAKANAAKFPSKLRKQNPWVRSVKPVQLILKTR